MDDKVRLLIDLAQDPTLSRLALAWPGLLELLLTLIGTAVSAWKSAVWGGRCCLACARAARSRARGYFAHSELGAQVLAALGEDEVMLVEESGTIVMAKVTVALSQKPDQVSVKVGTVPGARVEVWDVLTARDRRAVLKKAGQLVRRAERANAEASRAAEWRRKALQAIQAFQALHAAPAAELPPPVPACGTGLEGLDSEGKWVPISGCKNVPCPPEDPEVVKIVEHYKARERGFPKGMTAAKLVEGYLANRKYQPGLTAAQFLGLDK